MHVRIQKGLTPPPKNHKNIGFLSNTSPDSLKNHKATKTAFNMGPSSARQQNAMEQWRFAGGSMIAAYSVVVCGSSLPSSTKQTLSKLDSLWQNFLDPRML